MIADDPSSQPALPTVRESNRQRTRNRILDTTVALVRESGNVEFTMPEVAARSGVALRTLYRYFAKRQDLVDALAFVRDQVIEQAPPSSLDDLGAWIEKAWRNLMADEALLRAQHLGEGGTRIRRSRTPSHRAATEALMNAACPTAPESVRADLVDMALLIGSSTAMFEFVDVLDVPIERGARLVADTIRTLIDQANRVNNATESD